MKKIIAFLLALTLIAAMSLSAYAATPKLDTPSISIPDISGSVKVEIPQSTFDKWFAEHPIKITLPKHFKRIFLGDQ